MTTTDLATTSTPSSAITLGQQRWTPEQRTVLANAGCAARNEADWNLFLFLCQRTGLDPFSRQIFMVDYAGKPTVQTGIDGYRVIAERAAREAGQAFVPATIEWCGPDGVWVDVWLGDEPPAAARATVTRGDHRVSAVAVFREYAGRRKDGTVNTMWANKPATMIGKCAEAAALRKAFPQDMAGVYITDEMTTVTVTQTTPPAPDGPKTAQYYMRSLKLTGRAFKAFAERVLGVHLQSWEALDADDQQSVLAQLGEWERTGTDPTILDTEASDIPEGVDPETGEITGGAR